MTMTPHPLTDKGRRLIAQLANTHDTILSRHVATLLSAEAYWRERAERLAGALDMAEQSGDAQRVLAAYRAVRRAVLAEEPKPVGLNEQHGKLQP